MHVVFLCNHFDPVKSEWSAINYALCVELAKQPHVRVYCGLPEAPPTAFKDAEKQNVTLIVPDRVRL